MNKSEAVVLFNALLTQVKSEKEISAEASAILTAMFPEVINPALEILDNGKVIKLECQDSKRYLYRVKEPSSKTRSNFAVGNQHQDPDTY
jgi:hypothetical protein